MATLDMTSLARRGAEARIQELKAEVNALLSMFPDLRSGTAGQRRGPKRTAITRAQAETGSATPVHRRQRKPMTAAQRKAVGTRMKKYWAARRKTAGKS